LCLRIIKYCVSIMWTYFFFVVGKDCFSKSVMLHFKMFRLKYGVFNSRMISFPKRKKDVAYKFSGDETLDNEDI